MTGDPAQLTLDLAKPRRAAVVRPAAGVIVGGPYNGWHYVLIELQRVSARTYPKVRATPPAWPFPRELVIKPPARLEAAP